MTKFLAVCSSGLGSSFMVHLNIEKVLKELGVTEVTVDHADLGSVSRGDADTIFVGRDIAEAAQDLGDVVALDSIIDLNELRAKVGDALNRHGIATA